MEIRYCEVCNRSSDESRISHWKKFDKTLCSKHYYQLKTYGKILKRTEKDKNEIVLYDDYAEIVVYSKTKAGEVPKEKGRAIIDLDDVEKLKYIKWKIANQGYVQNNKFGLLSRFLLNMPDYKIDKTEVDHVDNNPLNNRKINLRKATSGQQKQNTRKLKKGISKYKGVRLTKEGKWLSVIGFKKGVIRLGLFKIEEEAAKAYDKKALELFGEFANINFPNNKKESE